MSKHFDRALIVTTVVATLCVVPLFLRYERTHDWNAEGSEVIANMSESEREDLLAGEKRLAELPDDKRATVVALHAASADPETASTLDAYDEWLQGLGIVERDAIRSAPTTERTVAAVQTLLSEAEDRANGFYIEPEDWRIRFYGSEFVEQLQLDMTMDELSPLWVSDREYGEMIMILADALPHDLRGVFDERLEKLSPSANSSTRLRARNAAMARAMSMHFRKQRSRRQKSRNRFQSLPLSAETVDAAVRVFEDSRIREGLLKLEDRQKEAIVNAIWARCIDQFRFIKPYLPTDKEVQVFYTQLDRSVQIKMMGVSSLRTRLNLMFVAAGGINSEAASPDAEPDIPTDIVDMATSVLEQIKKFEQHPRGGRRSGGASSRGDRGSRDRGGPPGGGRPERDPRPK